MNKLISNNYYTLILMMIGIIIIGIIIMLIPLFSNKKNKEQTKDKETNKKLIITPEDEEQLKKEIFSIYKKLETAKSKFDYETLKNLLEESLYQEVEQKLQQLKNKHQKQVATNIKLQEINILSITNKEEIQNINIYLHVSQYSYIINNKKNIISGTDETEYQIEYKITLEKNNDNQIKFIKQKCTGKWIKNN